jgi:hypothetical protein
MRLSGGIADFSRKFGIICDKAGLQPRGMTLINPDVTSIPAFSESTTAVFGCFHFQEGCGFYYLGNSIAFACLFASASNWKRS